ncbi:DUF3152 domain-containing protein [Streptomyces sp. RerS4]|uniref:DUF3152 domain-containing protein n=1 Tax=Streptomyces sp. RerS4 TaxID=2942449 RepID=UPI00201BA562|nr:DUF3152 domain-containing protein [Streptomyces sp. RerS4]UQX02424.1 DUF3152 domain-containing protein [Streptomyces sp. RerS4]
MAAGTYQSARRAERLRRLRRTLLCATGLVVLGVAAWQRGSDEPPAPADAAPPRPTASSAASAAAPAPTGPSTGPSTGFAASTAAGRAQGQGPPMRWRVEVERGSGVDPDEAAHGIEAILGDRRGWIRDPANGFRLAGPGEPVEFTVKIATPATTDRLCEVVTPELVGETNCRVGHTVVVNLKRWQEGSPQFRGPVKEYRALIVNHEVGHELGHGHETCPGPGKPAPAMMQQIKGLQGCTANAWPYAADGTYLSGPRVP